jgi:hypothetical protein
MSIAELQARLERASNDVELLRALAHELDHRKTKKAAQLRAQVRQALSTVEVPRVPTDRSNLATDSTRDKARTRQAVRTSAPAATLDAWTALEVLSPQRFQRPEELASAGDPRAVAPLEEQTLPWETGEDRARPKTRLYYHVVLGTISFETSVSQLLSRYTDRRDERSVVSGECILATVTVDHLGKLVDGPATAISSFGWGLPRVLRGELTGLAEWQAAEQQLINALDKKLRISDTGGGALPLDHATIAVAYGWLVRKLGLPQDLVKKPRFAIRAYAYYRNNSLPEPLILNSFYLRDLAAAKALFAQGRATPNLQRYLGAQVPSARRDLLRDKAALEEVVAPGKIPPARWPGPRRHPLVLLQQAAVNLAMSELRDEGILAVNGPPGTGKTTLLRDLVAAIVTARAEVMASFDDPKEAFTQSGERVRAGQDWLHLYRLDERLRGFEMIIASSNNKAVENVSAELPGLEAIADDANDLRYFKTVSNALRGDETWGLIAAVLGNAANRKKFRQSFWQDKECGLATYLAAAAGTPQMVEVEDSQTGSSRSREPRVVTAEQAPRNREEALQRWQSARASFRTALAKSRESLQALNRVREFVRSLPALAKAAAHASAAADEARGAEDRVKAAVVTAQERLALAQRVASAAETSLAEQDVKKPGLFQRLFGTKQARDWQSTRAPLLLACQQAQAQLEKARVDLERSEQRLLAARGERELAERRLYKVREQHATAQREAAAARKWLGPRIADAEFFKRDHADKHTTVPWLDARQQRIRDDVFIAAMALHKAFIDVAAKPLWHNLGALMSEFSRSLPQDKRPLLPELWSSLSLVVPLLSTTFASTARMLGALPPNSLGWLLVDEAGQALPQAAVGALMRTRRAVVVGDPMQIEPVVVLPETLTTAICQHSGVDPDRFNAPLASVQTLADAATPYCAEFESRQGCRTVGVPLLVHRRCAEPMFSISNAIAYERLMVSAKAQTPSRIREVLGPSAWFDVQGLAQGKWCHEEGEFTLDLLRRLAKADLVPDLHIITPFRMVADNLRRLVKNEGFLKGWTDAPWKWVNERIGTVHKVQGREAEAVILVLGAPEPGQRGARGWAGGRANLLNVAVTRAKEQLYVIGNRRLWREAGLFSELDACLPPFVSGRG